jgi:hypothetical protein
MQEQDINYEGFTGMTWKSLEGSAIMISFSFAYYFVA